jgi:transcriptional regulator with XRE-family HTH domain
MSYCRFASGYYKIELKHEMTNLKALLSYNIKKRREKLGISQANLAERADTSTNYIAQIEQQNRFPSSEMLERLAAALEFDSPELFSSGPFPVEAIQQFHEGIKADVDKRIERLMKSNK